MYVYCLTHTHTYTHSHTHTFPLSITLTHAMIPPTCLLSFSILHTHTLLVCLLYNHTLEHTFSHSLPLTRTRTRTCTHTHTHKYPNKTVQRTASTKKVKLVVTKGLQYDQLECPKRPYYKYWTTIKRILYLFIHILFKI